MLRPGVVVVVLLIGAGLGWLFWGGILPQLDGFLVGGQNSRTSDRVDWDTFRIMDVRDGEAKVVFCMPSGVDNDEKAWVLFYHTDFRGDLAKNYRQNHPKGSPSKFNIVLFGTYYEVLTQIHRNTVLTRYLSTVEQQEDFKCPFSHFEFHYIVTEYDS